MSLLSVSNLEVEFPTDEGLIQAVDEVSFEIKQGEILGLVGESGAGKSVTADAVMRLIESPGYIKSGTVTFKGENLMGKSTAELRRIRGGEIAMIFQDPMTSMNPVYTVGKQIHEAIVLHQNLSSDKARERAIEMLDQVGISDPEVRYDSYPHELSGGMLQRAMIAMALACEPDLLIADEPTTALDVTIEAQILDIIEGLTDEFDMSVLLITHDLGVVAEVCDRVCVMYAGEIVESAPIQRIFDNPRHPYTQGLLASIPKITGDRAKALTSIDGTMPNPWARPSGCNFHPRCPYATEACRGEPIELESVDQTHESRCIHWEDLDETWPVGADVDIDRGQLETDPVVEVSELRKWFTVEDSLLERISIGRNGGRWPISMRQQYVKAVDGISFTLRAGETLGLVGESGCGKSTTAKSLIGLIEANTGDIHIQTRDGERVNLTELSKRDIRAVRQHVQFIFQDPQSSLNPRKTVRKIVGRPMKLHRGLSGEALAEEVDDILRRVDLEPDHADRYPHELSGGQQQRVGIARALAVDPDVLIADEPTSALDVSVQAQIINLLMELQDEFGLSILFIAHDLSVVRHISDRIAVMYLGHIMEIGTVDDVFSPPYHPYTAALLSSVPVADPSVSRIRARIEGAVPSPIDPPSGCPFHTRCPHAIEGTCDAAYPPIYEAAEGHEITCVLEDEKLPSEIILNVPRP